MSVWKVNAVNYFVLICINTNALKKINEITERRKHFWGMFIIVSYVVKIFHKGVTKLHKMPQSVKKDDCRSVVQKAERGWYWISFSRVRANVIQEARLWQIQKEQQVTPDTAEASKTRSWSRWTTGWNHQWFLKTLKLYLAQKIVKLQSL